MFKKIIALFETIGYARAASQLASQGYLQEAKELMIQRDKARKTYQELSALTDKELNDIGINRGDIHRISYEKAA